MTHWSQSLIPSDDTSTRINGICVGALSAAGETVCKEVSLLYVYMTEGVPLSIAKCREGQTGGSCKI